LGECQLVFRIQTTALVESLKDILILENNTDMQEGEESPSILGMDVLRNYKLTAKASNSFWRSKITSTSPFSQLNKSWDILQPEWTLFYEIDMQEQDFLPGFPQAGIYYETAVSILLIQLLDEMLSIQQNFILT
jgi:hypothetical protein